MCNTVIVITQFFQLLYKYDIFTRFLSILIIHTTQGLRFFLSNNSHSKIQSSISASLSKTTLTGCESTKEFNIHIKSTVYNFILRSIYEFFANPILQKHKPLIAFQILLPKKLYDHEMFQ